MKDRDWRSARPGRALRAAARTLGAIVAAGAILLSGCIGSSTPPPVITGYTLEYPPPDLPARSALGAALAVALTPATQALAGEDMLYQAAPYRRNTYTFAHWASPPAELLSALLTRDLARSAFFTAVFSAPAGLAERFLVQGIVDEFVEVDTAGKGSGHAGLTVALIDTRPPDGGRVVLYQKHYSAEGPGMEQNPDGFAASMSKAVAEISPALVEDVYTALSAYLLHKSG